jgi:hypothetical protein
MRAARTLTPTCLRMSIAGLRQGDDYRSTDYESHFSCVDDKSARSSGGLSLEASLQVHLADSLKWSSRGRLPTQPGIYVISKKSSDNIIYVGKTWGGDGLRGRVAAFHRSAITGAKGHAGGVTYHSKFGSSVTDLFVAAHVPVTIRREPEILRAYLLYVERRLVWEFVERAGWLPECNSE